MKIEHLFENADIHTDEFKAWFGKSVVTRYSSSTFPTIVYHGSPDAREIQSTGIFKPSHSNRPAIFFTDNRGVAVTYADDNRAFDYQNSVPATLACYLRIENPLIVDAEFNRWRNTEDNIPTAIRKGHDGLILKNSYDEYGTNADSNGKASTVYVVFDPHQIKSVNNDGSFDIDDPSIFS